MGRDGGILAAAGEAEGHNDAFGPVFGAAVLIFEGDIRAGAATDYYVYFSAKPKKKPAYETDLAAKPTDDPWKDMVLTNSVLMELAVKARNKGTTDKEIAGAGNWGKGGMRLKMGNAVLAGPCASWSGMVIPGHPLNVSAKTLDWTTPVVAAAGPVRITAKIEVETDIQKDTLENGRPMMVGLRGKTKFTHYFSLYGKSRVADFEEVVDYTESACVVSLRYWFPVLPGGGIDTNDVLIAPEYGKPKTILLKEMNIPKDSQYFRLYTNPLVPNVSTSTEPGYFAWYDRAAGNGMAVYYDSDYRLLRISPLLITVNGQTLYLPSGARLPSNVEMIYTFADRPLKTPGRLDVRCRFAGLTEESAAAVASGYGVWKGGDGTIRVSTAETGGK